MRRTTTAIALAFMIPVCAAAQNDRSAGLFTTARQLPLVSQSLVVRAVGGEARLELTQVFANDGPELAQADYRLHLPRGASVTAFGFWHDGEFLAAELKERGEARRAHTAAAASGHATALAQRDGAIHSFSVFPVVAGGLQEVVTTIAVPVASEGSSSSVRLPLDTFLGHAPVTSTVIVYIETNERLVDVRAPGALVAKRSLGGTHAELAFTADAPVEVGWTTEGPPLLTRASAVSLDDGTTALQLRLALNEPPSDISPPRAIVVLIDASASMRRRGEALRTLLHRFDEQTRSFYRGAVPLRFIAVADRTIELTGASRADMLRRILSGDAGFATSWADLEGAAIDTGCDESGSRCLIVTDPQVLDLPRTRDLETLFLADADELAHFDDVLGRSARVARPDEEPVAALQALADELVLPVLELHSARQGRTELEPVGAPRMQVAAGGLLRLDFASTSFEPVVVELDVAGRVIERTIEVEALDPASRMGRAVRRSFFRGRLDDWTAEYRRLRDPELRRQIVQVSLREEIPTDFTALHAASPDRVLTRAGTTAPLLRRLGLVLLALGVAGLAIGRRWLP